MNPAVVAVVLGTHPEAIKLAPVIRELAQRPGIQPRIVSTGQHRATLHRALALFDLRLDVDLELMLPAPSLHDVTCAALEQLKAVYRRWQPRWVIVQGDTTTALAGALAAFYEKIPIAHVEAGLRSSERYEPFPEEMNRRLVDQLSDVVFAPTALAGRVLHREGFAPSMVHVTGNTVVDALTLLRDRVRRTPPVITGLRQDALAGKRILLVTAHRRESFGDAFASMCRALRRIVDQAPEVGVVYPAHLNPSVAGPVRALLGGHERIALLEPVTDLELVALMDRAHLILTDSEGVQEEAPTFGRPTLVMRNVTERSEGVEAGVARLVGTNEERIVRETMRLLRDPAAYAAMASGTNPYGDGHAAARIADVIAQKLASSRPRRAA